MISVIIPTHNSAKVLPAALQSLFDAAIDGLASEVIVSDCGSIDKTKEIAESAGATVIEAGQGQQLLAGVEAARKPWILLLEPGVALEKGWEDEARAFMAKGETGAAGFRLKLAGEGFGPRLREFAAAARARAFGTPRCCQALLIPAKLLEGVRGFVSMPPISEADVMKRLGRARVSTFKAAAIVFQ